MPNEPIDWEGACTLEDYVISIFEKKQTDSLEFKALLRVYGRERLEKIWREYKQRRGSNAIHE
jgi:hypothetical protein